ncbi:MAG: non-canonical purine NTP pyrophosphatase [Gemmatimonadota bacterium]|nr:non-canonical purine NTP pyrophosphatase [Gemmatimonadota bacterium]
MTTSVLIATRNPGKAREIRAILASLPHQLKFLSDTGIPESPEEAQLEHAESFEGNARRKAEYFARISGGPTVADDSGLEVLALGGLPGVRSRRFALCDGPADEQDQANNAELLRRLDGLPDERRRARYRCVVAFVPRPDAVAYTFEGACAGRILTAPEGTGGFGYDPLFYSDDLEMSFGLAPADEKDAVSHRGRAFRAFAEWLEARGG